MNKFKNEARIIVGVRFWNAQLEFMSDEETNCAYLRFNKE